jgi:hypothetical protein
LEPAHWERIRGSLNSNLPLSVQRRETAVRKMVQPYRGRQKFLMTLEENPRTLRREGQGAREVKACRVLDSKDKGGR